MTSLDKVVGPGLFLTSDSQQPPLRIGLAVDSQRLPLWKRAVVELIGATDYAELVVLLQADRPAMEPARTWRDVFFRQYARLDRRLYGSRRAPDPDRLVDCRDLLGAVPLQVLSVDNSGHERKRCVTEQAAAYLRSLDLDVVIDLGTGTLDDTIAGYARCGTWRCHFGPGPDAGEAHAGLPELVRRESLTSVSLLRHTGSHAREQLAVATTSTAPGVSWTLNRFDPLWMATELLVQTLHRLHQQGPEALPSCPGDVATASHTASPRAPSNATTLGFLASALTRKAHRRMQHPSADLVNEWRLALRPVPEGAGAIPVLQEASAFHWLESPPGCHWADPFILERDGQAWLFFEEYIYAEERGVISVAALDANGRTGPAQRILDSGGHLSYPYLFEDGDDVYLLPESADRRSTTIYRATDFPYAWEPAAELGEGMQLLDTTMLHHDGRYWVFTAVPGRHRSGYTVLLFHAESLHGPWHAHPASPISRDIRYARGAGRIIRSGDRLFRPVQDGAGGYGRKVHFFEITELTADTFREEHRGTLAPDTLPDPPRGLEGIHTYNRSSRFEVIDGVRLKKHPGRPDTT